MTPFLWRFWGWLITILGKWRQQLFALYFKWPLYENTEKTNKCRTLLISNTSSGNPGKPTVTFTCMSFKWKVTSHILDCFNTSGTELRLRTLPSQGLSLHQPTILSISFSFRLSPFTSQYLKLEVLFHLRLAILSLVKTFQFHLGSAVMERKLISNSACFFHSSPPSGFCCEDGKEVLGLAFPWGMLLCHPLWRIVAREKLTNKIKWDPWYLSYTPASEIEQPGTKIPPTGNNSKLFDGKLDPDGNMLLAILPSEFESFPLA